jgi:hypothetical protein
MYCILNHSVGCDDELMAEQVKPAPGKPGVTQGFKCRFDEDQERGFHRGKAA